MDEPDEDEIRELRSELSMILERLDQLGLFQAGAHVTMALHALRSGNGELGDKQVS